tara:strand:- start:3323 stop:5020 length:1698 start_codon:yes stop_codon:yes gene_type:complete
MPTLLELFKNKDSFKYGTAYSEVKSDTETLVEQETSGIRIKSLVEINNPLIYGNEAGRISLRSTPDLEKMKSNTGGEGGDGGLIGKGLGKLTGGKINSISDVRDKINTKLGIPQNLIPTKVSDEVIKLRGKELTSADPITPDIMGENGTGLGKFLKNSGGGNPKTIGKQALGNGIGFAKDKLRGALFGEAQGLGDAQGTKEPQVNYTTSKKGETYSDQKESVKNAKGDELLEELKETKLDLSKVSPIYGVERKASGNKQKGTFGIGNNPFSFDSANPKKGEKLPTFTPKEGEGYSDFIKDNDDKVTLNQRGISNAGDTIAMGDPYTTTVNTENGEVTVEGFSPVKDLIPLFIGRYKSTTYPMMAFRCSITGLTETSSPSWASNNFVGNPYKYYIFETVERSVSFNLQVYAQNPLELANNWSKLSNLTKLSYPLIENNMAHPNFTEFTLGDMYREKVCILEALTYTFPDNGTWEIDTEGLLLPKFIDVALTLKFVENIEDGSVRGLYSFPKNLSSEGEVTSQHEIYSTPNKIEYFVTDENGELKKGSKDNYIGAGVGVRKTIKIKN